MCAVLKQACNTLKQAVCICAQASLQSCSRTYDHICKAAAVHLSKPAKLQLSICSSWQSISQHMPNPAKLHLIVYNVRLPASSKLLLYSFQDYCNREPATNVLKPAQECKAAVLHISSSLHKNCSYICAQLQACTAAAMYMLHQDIQVAMTPT